MSLFFHCSQFDVRNTRQYFEDVKVISVLTIRVHYIDCINLSVNLLNSDEANSHRGDRSVIFISPFGNFVRNFNDPIVQLTMRDGTERHNSMHWAPKRRGN